MQILPQMSVRPQDAIPSILVYCTSSHHDSQKDVPARAIRLIGVFHPIGHPQTRGDHAMIREAYR